MSQYIKGITATCQITKIISLGDSERRDTMGERNKKRGQGIAIKENENEYNKS